MDSVGVRELQQNASAVLRRVERGESVGVTQRGRLIAVLNPAPTLRGLAALEAAGRVRPATRRGPLPPPVKASRSIREVLDELREDKI